MGKWSYQEHVITQDGRNGIVTGREYGTPTRDQLLYVIEFEDGTLERFAEGDLSDVPAVAVPVAEVVTIDASPAEAATNPKLAAVKPAE